VTTGVKASVNVGTAADARPLHVAFDVVIVELVVTLVGTGEPPLHFVAVALMVATSDAMVALVNGGENLMVPVTLVQVVSPVPVVLDFHMSSLRDRRNRVAPCRLAVRLTKRLGTAIHYITVNFRTCYQARRAWCVDWKAGTGRRHT
jgi:hypothetical protein